MCSREDSGRAHMALFPGHDSTIQCKLVHLHFMSFKNVTKLKINILNISWGSLPVFLSRFPAKSFYGLNISPMHATCLAHLNILDLVEMIMFGEQYELCTISAVFRNESCRMLWVFQHFGKRCSFHFQGECVLKVLRCLI